MEFGDWLTKKYTAWRGDAIGNDRSIIEFGKFIGVDKTSLTLWMRGKRKPTLESAIKIAEIYPEVYDVLGLPRPGKSVSYESLPSDIRTRFESASDEFNRLSIERHITNPDTPEAHALAREVFSRYGFTIASIE
jgi:DNA-binding XRE family transcriptional regulator